MEDLDKMFKEKAGLVNALMWEATQAVREAAPIAAEFISHASGYRDGSFNHLRYVLHRGLTAEQEAQLVARNTPIEATLAWGSLVVLGLARWVYKHFPY